MTAIDVAIGLERLLARELTCRNGSIKPTKYLSSGLLHRGSA
jgi:hypothetical protein